MDRCGNTDGYDVYGYPSVINNFKNIKKDPRKMMGVRKTVPVPAGLSAETVLVYITVT